MVTPRWSVWSWSEGLLGLMIEMSRAPIALALVCKRITLRFISDVGVTIYEKCESV